MIYITYWLEILIILPILYLLLNQESYQVLNANGNDALLLLTLITVVVILIRILPHYQFLDLLNLNSTINKTSNEQKKAVIIKKNIITTINLLRNFFGITLFASFFLIYQIMKLEYYKLDEIKLKAGLKIKRIWDQNELKTLAMNYLQQQDECLTLSSSEINNIIDTASTKLKLYESLDNVIKKKRIQEMVEAQPNNLIPEPEIVSKINYGIDSILNYTPGFIKAPIFYTFDIIADHPWIFPVLCMTYPFIFAFIGSQVSYLTAALKKTNQSVDEVIQGNQETQQSIQDLTDAVDRLNTLVEERIREGVDINELDLKRILSEMNTNELEHILNSVDAPIPTTIDQSTNLNKNRSILSLISYVLRNHENRLNQLSQEIDIGRIEGGQNFQNTLQQLSQLKERLNNINNNIIANHSATLNVHDQSLNEHDETLQVLMKFITRIINHLNGDSNALSEFIDNHNQNDSSSNIKFTIFNRPNNSKPIFPGIGRVLGSTSTMESTDSDSNLDTGDDNG